MSMPNISLFAARGSCNDLLKNRQICADTVRGPLHVKDEQMVFQCRVRN